MIAVAALVVAASGGAIAANASINGNAILPGTIGSVRLANGAVTAPKIAAAAVTAPALSGS